jgi:hypothetical protein
MPAAALHRRVCVADVDFVFSGLAHRPDIDAAAVRYGQMYAEVRRRLSEVVPSVTGWRPIDRPSTALCGADVPGLGADGQTRSLGNWLADAPVPDADWTDAVAAVHEVVHSYGFTSGPVGSVDRPGDHEVAFYDDYQAQLTVGTGKHTGLLLITGCHLTAEAKRRGHPAEQSST